MIHSLPQCHSLFCALLLCLFSCSDHHTDEVIGSSIAGDSIDAKDVPLQTRRPPEDAITRIVSFQIVYEGDLNAMLTREHSAFKYLINTYELQMDTPNNIDELDNQYKVLTLYTHLPLDSPVEVGKKLSLIDEVLMVQVGDAAPDEGIL